MKAFLFLVFVSCGLQTFSQDVPKMYEKATIYYSKKEYQNALEYYKCCLVKKSKKYVPFRTEAMSKIASCYVFLNQNKDAEAVYRQLVLNSTKPDSNLFLFAQVLKKNQKYQEARLQFQILAKANPDENIYMSFTASCDSAVKWMKAGSNCTVKNLSKLNSEYSDITPYGYKKGIAFASNREEVIIRRKSELSDQPFYNIYFSEMDSLGNIGNAKNFSPIINSIHHEASACFNKDYTKIYFTRGRSSSGKKDSINRLKLFSSENVNGNWKRAERFIFNDSSFSFAHPSIDSEEKMFFFASDMPGGFGGTDIYVCFNVSGKWTNPVNLGAIINSKGDELYPYYHSSTGALYFSSAYHPGLGGLDIFQAIQKDGEWVRVENLKAPINSSADDFSIYLTDDKSKGYFSSNRDGGEGAEDIYQIEFNK